MNLGMTTETVWPGQAIPGMVAPMPQHFLGAPAGTIFGGGASPQFQGFFNTQSTGTFGRITQTLGQTYIPQLMSGTSRSPFQFFPAQNPHDQLQARRYYEEQQRAMTAGARQDTGQIANTISGFNRLWLGRDLSQSEIARDFQMGRSVAGMMPMLTQFLGADVVDQLHGSRGSATIFAQQVHAAMRTARDPVTGRSGYSGTAAGVLTQELQSQLFGPGANIAAMTGLSMGQAGLLAGELQTRGLLGNVGQLGPQSITAIRNRGAGFYDEAFIARAAERDPAIAARLQRGETVPEADYTAARDRVRRTRDRVLSPAGQNMSATDLQQADGGEDMLRAGDAVQISGRLRDMSRVVRAMRDIFGDNGNPNAPMREIIAGLQTLTQGGMSRLSASSLESLVRRTHVVGQQTGIGVQGMLALTSGAAAMADQLGVHRSVAVTSTQQSALYGGAARETQRLDRPSWGQLDLEQVTLADQRLRMLAAASPSANNLNSLVRLEQEGLIPAAPAGVPATEVQAMQQAVRDQQTTYTWNGQSQSLRMSRNRMRTALIRDHNLPAATVDAILNDRHGNQQFNSHTEVLNRELQTEDMGQRVGNAFAAPIVQSLTQGQGLAALRTAGVATDAMGARQFATGVAMELGSSFFDISSEDVSDPAKLRERMAERTRTTVRARIAQQRPGLTAAALDQATEQVLTGMGGASNYAAAAVATGNQQMTGTLYQSLRGLHQVGNRETAREQRRQSRQATATVLMQEALAGMGATPPLARIADALANARPNSNLRELLADIAGGIPQAQIDAMDPNGAVAGMLGLTQANQQLDVNNPQQFATFRRNARTLRALTEGGQLARTVQRELRNDPTLPADHPIHKQIADAIANGGSGAQLSAITPLSGATVSTTGIADVAALGARAETALAAGTGDAGTLTTQFATDAGARAAVLAEDVVSMRQLGSGGLALVQHVQGATGSLQEMAREAGQVAGRTVTVGELLRGGNGISDTLRDRGRTAFGRAQTAWAEINRRRNFMALPGQGGSAENQAREPATPEELREVEARRDFSTRFAPLTGAAATAADLNGDRTASPAEQQATNVVDRLIATTTGAARQRLSDDPETRRRLAREVAQGNRAGGLDAALRAQAQLVSLATAKGLFGAGRTQESLSAAERARAGELLGNAVSGGQITDTEQVARIRRMRSTAGPLEGIGAGATVDDIMGRIRQFRGPGADSSAAGAPGQAAADGLGGARTLALAGSVKITEDNRIVPVHASVTPQNTVDNLAPA